MRIFDNLLYKIVSLLIACVLWAAAQGVTDVEQSLDIPVAVEKVPDNLVVVEESAHEINLRVVGQPRGAAPGARSTCSTTRCRSRARSRARRACR